MPLLLNDCSIHGQFADPKAFEAAIETVMQLRSMSRRFGWEVFCHRRILFSQVTPTLGVREVVGRLTIDRQRAIMLWFTKNGPFWDEDPGHTPDDYLEFRGNVVTDTAIGEAGYSVAHGLDYRLISFTPSEWMLDPVRVEIVQDDEQRYEVDVRNYWDSPCLESDLKEALPPIQSWDDLKSCCLTQFTGLQFAAEAFTSMEGCPFSGAAATAILARLSVLDQITRCVEPDGSRNAEGQRLYTAHFEGERAWFSDSSDTEKNQMRERLTFTHPQQQGSLFCPWHGKVSTQTLRIHFSWPVGTDGTIYVAYLGPKLTKR